MTKSNLECVFAHDYRQNHGGSAPEKSNAALCRLHQKARKNANSALPDLSIMPFATMKYTNFLTIFMKYDL